MRALLTAFWLLFAALPASAQNAWSFLDPLLVQGLDLRPGEDGQLLLFPDHGDPTVATHALGFYYFPNRSGGNSFGLNVALFARIEAGWVLLGPVDGLFGVEPRDPLFTPDRVEITTLTLGPNEPRCCPTQITRWSVDLATRAVLQLN